MLDLGHLDLAFHLALGCVLVDDLVDLGFLGFRERVLVHGECLETGLPGKEHQQRSHASIPIVRKPSFLGNNYESLEAADMVVSEHLHQLVTVFTAAVRAVDVKRV